MKIHTIFFTICALGIFTLFTCNQNPLFYDIATAPPPEKALIGGTPTNMVVFERKGAMAMFTATDTRIFWYAKENNNDTDEENWESQWNLDEYHTPDPEGRIVALAATSQHLYALCHTGGTGTILRRIGQTGDLWEDITINAGDYTLLQTVYASSGKVFAGARLNSRETEDYAILYLDGTVLRILEAETSMLTGAASRLENGALIHYFSTQGSGIYQADDSTNTVTQLTEAEPDDPENPRNNRAFVGLILLPNNSGIIAVERTGGNFFEVSTNGTFKPMVYKEDGEPVLTDGEPTPIQTARYANGALAIWRNRTYQPPEPNGPAPYDATMLIAGIQTGIVSASYTYGYVEFDIDPVSGFLDETSIRRDPGRLQTIPEDTQGAYSLTLGRHPVNHLFQAPLDVDNNMTFFASTQSNGLWSLRNRPQTGIHWNAEN